MKKVRRTLLLPLVFMYVCDFAEGVLLEEAFNVTNGGIERVQLHAAARGEEGLLLYDLYRCHEYISTNSKTQITYQIFAAGHVLGASLMPDVSVEDFEKAMLNESGARAFEAFKGSRSIYIILPTQNIAGYDELYLSLLFGVPEFLDDVYPATFGFKPIAPLKRLSPFFLYQNHGQGWRWTWMGWVNDYHGYHPLSPTNWIFSLRHGWIWGTYPEVLLEWDYFSFFSFSIGWFLTNQEIYPMAWICDQNRWMNLTEL